MNRTVRKLGLFLIFIAMMTLLVGVLGADARVGGGHSYGGGGRRSGGGSGGHGGGGGGDLIFLLIELLVRLFLISPLAGTIVILIIVAVVFYAKSQGFEFTDSTPAGYPPPAPRRRMDPVKLLREEDANFSRPLFADFAVLVFNRGAVARSSGETGAVRPWFDARLLDAWERAAEQKNPVVEKVTGVVVGAQQLLSARISGDLQLLEVEFEANFTEHFKGDKSKSATWYTRERWTFQRKRGILSKGPGEITAPGCPGCGSSDELSVNGTCRSCGEAVNKGGHHWLVSGVSVLERRPWQPPALLPWSGPEEGTTLPTVMDPELAAARRAMEARHPQLSWDSFIARAKNTFNTLQSAWSAGDWEKVRHLETHSLYNTHRYWMENYREAGLSNRVEDVEIKAVDLARIETDAFYEGITVRIFAKAYDYTLDKQDKVVSGSKRTKQSFSEYWTFVRPAGEKKKSDGHHCPNCGAPVEPGPSTVCDFCASVVMKDSNEWVLAEIVQDEVYMG